MSGILTWRGWLGGLQWYLHWVRAQVLTELETALLGNFEERLTRLECSLTEFISSSSTDSNSAAKAVTDLEKMLIGFEERLNLLQSSLAKLMPLLEGAQKTSGSLSNEMIELRAGYSRLYLQIARLIEVLDA